MTTITDEFMKQMLSMTKNFTATILKKGKYHNRPDAKRMIWEHGRRNFSICEDGLLSIICPVNDKSEIEGIRIFNVIVERTKQFMDEYPGAKEGIFEHEIHPIRSFPGDCLPRF